MHYGSTIRRREEERGRKFIWRNTGWTFPKSGKGNEHPVSGSPTDSNKDETKEVQIKIYNNRIVKRQRQKENLEAVQKWLTTYKDSP